MKTLFFTLLVLSQANSYSYAKTLPVWEEEEDVRQPGQSEAERKRKAKENEESLRKADKKIQESISNEDRTNYRFDEPASTLDEAKIKK